MAHYLVLTKLATAAAADAALAADAQPAAAAPDQAPTADAAGVLIIKPTNHDDVGEVLVGCSHKGRCGMGDA